jgi:hypothetical protein
VSPRRRSSAWRWSSPPPRSAVCYSRVGVCVGPHATLATFATDLLNLVTGRLGREGGPMFTTPAFDLGLVARMAGLDGVGRWTSRVRGLPETLGDLPSAVLADEIETPGDGQIRAMVTLAGNPVLSVPNGKRLATAFQQLEFMVSIDIYINETTRHADVILPPCWNLSEDHIDLLFNAVAVRNIARWSPPVVAKSDDELADWEILLELTQRLGGGPIGEPWVDRLLGWLRPLGCALDAHGVPRSATAPRAVWRSLPSLVERAQPRKLKTAPMASISVRYRRASSGASTIRTSAFISPRPHAERDRGARARSRRTDSPGWARADRPARAAQQQLMDAQRSITGIGRERCVLYVHPTMRPATTCATASWPSSRAACIGVRCVSRSPTTCAPAWSACRTAGPRGQRAVAEGRRQSRGRVDERLGRRCRGRADHRPVGLERDTRAAGAGAAGGLTIRTHAACCARPCHRLVAGVTI